MFRRQLIRALPVAVAAALLVGLWHSSPVLLWHLRLEHQLRGQGDETRLESELERVRVGAPADWTEIVAGELALRAPLAAGEGLRCGECAVRCLLHLEDGGTLAIFDAPPPESYREALDLFAPDAGDLSLLRSVAANWRTIDALTDRVRVHPAPPASFRYVGDGSRGIATVFAVAGTSRYAIHAYGHDERPARVLGVTGISRVEVEAVLGNLRVDSSRSGGAASCSSTAARRRGPDAAAATALAAKRKPRS